MLTIKAVPAKLKPLYQNARILYGVIEGDKELEVLLSSEVTFPGGVTKTKFAALNEATKQIQSFNASSSREVDKFNEIVSSMLQNLIIGFERLGKEKALTETRFTEYENALKQMKAIGTHLFSIGADSAQQWLTAHEFLTPVIKRIKSTRADDRPAWARSLSTSLPKLDELMPASPRVVKRTRSGPPSATPVQKTQFLTIQSAFKVLWNFLVRSFEDSDSDEANECYQRFVQILSHPVFKKLCEFNFHGDTALQSFRKELEEDIDDHPMPAVADTPVVADTDDDEYSDDIEVTPKPKSKNKGKAKKRTCISVGDGEEKASEIAELNSQLAAQKKQIEALTAEKRVMAGECQELKSQLAAQKKQIEALTAEKRVIAGECQELKSQLAAQKKQIETLKAEGQGLKKQLNGDIKSLSIEKDKMQVLLDANAKKITNHEEEIKSKKVQVQTFKSQWEKTAEELTKLAVDNEQLETKYKALKEENHKLKEQLRVQSEVITELAAKIPKTDAVEPTSPGTWQTVGAWLAANKRSQDPAPSP